MRRSSREQGLEDAIEVDCAGTGGWHVGDPPDRRATAAAQARGVVLDGAARQVARADFARLRPDPGRRTRSNVRDLRRSRRDGGAGAGPPPARVRPGVRRRARPRRPRSLLRRRRRLRARARPGRGGLPRAARRPARRRQAVIAAAAGARARRAASRGPQPVAGGDLNAAWRLELEGGKRAFVKTRADAAPGEYAAEAAGLRWLGEPGALRVPARARRDRATFLVLEWLDPGLVDAGGARARAGDVHAAGAPAFGAPPPGAPDGELPARPARPPAGDRGRLGRASTPSTGSRRSLRMAAGRGALPRRRRAAVEAVLARHRRSSAGPPEPPGADARRPLVGQRPRGPRDVADRPGRARRPPRGRPRDARGSSARRRRASSRPTSEAAPLADGHEARVPLFQLLPLLVHAVLFGGGYGASVERAARAALM